MKTKLKLVAVGGAAVAVAGAFVKLQPSSFSSEQFDFHEYMFRVLALPIALLGATILLVACVMFTRSGDAFLRGLAGIKDASGLDLTKIVRSWGIMPAFVVLLALSALGYSGFLFARTAYVYARDRLISQYDQELWAKARLEEEAGNLAVAEERFKVFGASARSESQKSLAEIATWRIVRALADKESLLKQGDQLEKTFGINPRSFTTRALALQIAPYDEELYARVSKDVDATFPKAVDNVAQAAKQCASGTQPSAKSVGAALVALGFLQAQEVAKSKSTGKRTAASVVCAMVGTWHADTVRDRLAKIWDVGEVKELLAQVAPATLERKKRDLWKRWTTPAGDDIAADIFPEVEWDQGTTLLSGWTDSGNVPEMMSVEPRIGTDATHQVVQEGH